jgi:GrpB-like predicted nucleotidyltransferase (UPF0157 family)
MTEAEIQAAHVAPVAPPTAPIVLMDSDPQWARFFEREAARVHAALGDRVLALEHVGSTSVAGLAAKPIIDIVLAVRDSSDEPSYVADLESAGYALTIREPNWHEHRMFKRPDVAVHLHVFSSECPEVGRMVRFRDWLRRDASDRRLYEDTKRELSRRPWKYGQNYADAKTAVVLEILERAKTAAE